MQVGTVSALYRSLGDVAGLEASTSKYSSYCFPCEEIILDGFDNIAIFDNELKLAEGSLLVDVLYLNA